MGDFLFMGQQEDPEMDTWLARGGIRVYDSSWPAETWTTRQPKDVTTATDSTGSLWVIAPGGRVRRCTCGGCLFGAGSTGCGL